MAAVEAEEEDAAVVMAADGRSTASTAAFLRKPDVLVALQRRLQAQFLRALPVSVQRRIRCLKNIQRQLTDLEAKFYEEVHLLEMKYHEQYTPYYERRGAIVAGVYEPTDQESDFPLDDREEEEMKAAGDGSVEDVEGKAEGKSKEDDDGVKGVPEFWLTVFKNIQMWNVSDMVQEYDEPVLKHLQDIRVNYHTSNPMGFTLEFHFSPNAYFTNPVLTKMYEMRCVPDAEDPFSFEGPDIYKCKGCTIDWNKGMNVTLKLVKKQSDQEQVADSVVSITAAPSDSFFNFFSPPHTPKDPEAEIDEETQFLLASDFAIGHYIRERIVPRAVLYFTGDALISEEYERNIRRDDGRLDMEDLKSDYSFENVYPSENQSETNVVKPAM